MFDLSETKHVRRSDLHSPSPPTTPTHTTLPPDAAQQKLHSLLSTLLPLDLDLPSPAHTQSHPQSPPPNADQPQPKDESEYEFPLFTLGPTSQPTIHRVTLRTPTPPLAIEDIYLTSYYALAATQHRPPTYYFSSPTPSPTLLSCAISGEDILTHARRDKWLGQTYPWRLITVSATPPRTPPRQKPTPELGMRRKCKPGKKRRIYLRQAALKKEAQKLALETRRQAEVMQRKKEEEDANLKRALKNRERKAKKRAREKAKKLAASGGDCAVGVTGAGTGGAGGSGGESAGEGGKRMDVDR